MGRYTLRNDTIRYQGEILCIRYQSRRDMSAKKTVSFMESMFVQFEKPGSPYLMDNNSRFCPGSPSHAHHRYGDRHTGKFLSLLETSGIPIRSLVRLDLAGQYTEQSHSRWKCTYDSHKHILGDEYTDCQSWYIVAQRDSHMK